MIEDALKRLKRAETLINDSEMFMGTEPYYLKCIRDISSDLEQLIMEMETHL